MSSFFIFVGCALLALMLPVLYRVVAGPTAIDRIVAVNVIGTKTAVMLVVIGTILDRNQNQVAMFVDFALAYALLNFIGSLAAARFFHRTKGHGAVPEGVEADDL